MFSHRGPDPLFLVSAKRFRLLQFAPITFQHSPIPCPLRQETISPVLFDEIEGDGLQDAFVNLIARTDSVLNVHELLDESARLRRNGREFEIDDRDRRQSSER